MATIVAAAGGGNWGTGATWTGGVVPTSADDVQLTGSSGSVTINVAAVCRSLDCTGYTGTLTHTAAITLSVGDGTAGAGNVALKLVAGMTYTLGNSTTSALSFVSTSATQQTISWGGKVPGNVTFNGAGGSWQLQDSWNAPSTTITLTAGSLSTNSQACTWLVFSSSNANTRTLTCGSSALTILGASVAWDINTTTGLVITANTATLTMSGSAAILQTATMNYNGMSLVMNGAGTAVIGSGSATFANVTRTGTAAKTDALQLNGSPNTLTVTGTLTMSGNSAINRLIVRTGNTGTQVTINAAAVALSNIDFQDINATGVANWNLSAITGGSGDCGNNTGITFTTAAAQTWQGTVGGNWSDVTKWTSRVPLPQDDALINATFTAGQTITTDMPRLGRNIDWTGVSGAPIWSINSNTASIYGSLTLAASMSTSGTQILVFAGHGSYTITSAGQAFSSALNVTGTAYTLQDALITAGALTVSFGSLNTNNQTVTCGSMSMSQSLTTLALGNSIINLTGTGAGSLFVRGSGALTAGTATINIVNASANARNISPQGLAFANATINYTVAGSTGSLAVSISSSFSLAFGAINFSDSSNSRTLIFPAATTTTLGALNATGSVGKLMSITSSVGGSAATLIKTSGVVNADYLSLQDSAATGGASWYAGVNSTNVSNNTGWFFQAYSPSKFLELMQ